MFKTVDPYCPSIKASISRLKMKTRTKGTFLILAALAAYLVGLPITMPNQIIGFRLPLISSPDYPLPVEKSYFATLTGTYHVGTALPACAPCGLQDLLVSYIVTQSGKSYRLINVNITKPESSRMNGAVVQVTGRVVSPSTWSANLYPDYSFSGDIFVQTINLA
jgi:hypothetical protein